MKYVLEQDKAAFIRLTGISVLQSAASSIVAPSLRHVLSLGVISVESNFFVMELKFNVIYHCITGIPFYLFFSLAKDLHESNSCIVILKTFFIFKFSWHRKFQISYKVVASHHRKSNFSPLAYVPLSVLMIMKRPIILCYTSNILYLSLVLLYYDKLFY